MTKRKQKMPMRDAMALVDDDMPDCAFWAMAHEFAGLDYGDGFDELIEEDEKSAVRVNPLAKSRKCLPCGKRFWDEQALQQHCRDTGHAPAKCHDCNRLFKDETAVRHHARAKHQKEPT